MADKPKYYDNRAEFWETCWSKALVYEDYIVSGEDIHQKKWSDVYDSIEVPESETQRLAPFNGLLRILVLSGIWCGDCVRQGPVLKKISECVPNSEIKYIDNRDNPEVQDELRICGAMRVPVAVFLTEDFFELGRFGDRLLGCYRKKLETETGAVCSTGLAVPDDVLQQDISEWASIFERMSLILRLSPHYKDKYGN